MDDNTSYNDQLNIDTKSMISLIQTDLYAMEKGMRECCSHQVPKSIWNNVLSYLKKYFDMVPETKDFKVSYKFYDIKGDLYDYYEVFIYKYHHQLEIYEVIEYMEENNVGNAKVLYVTEWMKGALFGYSAQSNEMHLSHYPRPDKTNFANL